MKFDEKKRMRLANKLEPIPIKDDNNFVWLPVAEVARREGITVQAVLQRIHAGKCEARAAGGVLIVVKQEDPKIEKEVKNGTRSTTTISTNH